MDNKTMEYCLHLLDEQEKYIKKDGERQEAFYKGMRLMLEVIISDLFTNGKGIVFTNGKHEIGKE